MSQQSFPGLCLPLLLTTISEQSMANCPRPIQVFVSSSGQQIEGVAQTTHRPTSQSKGLYGGKILIPVWIQDGLHVPNLPIRELSLIQGLFAGLTHSLSSVLFTYLTNSSLSGARTDACQSVDQILTPYMNILTLIKPLMPFLQTLHLGLTFHLLKCCHSQFSLMQ